MLPVPSTGVALVAGEGGLSRVPKSPADGLLLLYVLENGSEIFENICIRNSIVSEIDTIAVD